MPDNTRTYLTAALDQLTAANATGDEHTATETLARLISDNHPGARAAIADALGLAAARDQATDTPDSA